MLDCVLLIIMDLKQYLHTKIWVIFDLIVKDIYLYHQYISVQTTQQNLSILSCVVIAIIFNSLKLEYTDI